MKQTRILNLLVVVLAFSLGVAGCKHKPLGPTPIVGPTGKPGGTGEPSGLLTGTKIDEPTPPKPVDIPPGGLEQTRRFDPDAMNQDRDRFAANTVYFDFDRATIKPSETSKLDEVVKYLQGNPTHAVQVEGHCDERGTEQYNLSLGERRALAVREYLVTAGIAAGRVFTISYGENAAGSNAR